MTDNEKQAPPSPMSPEQNAQRTAAIDKPIQSDPWGNLIISTLAGAGQGFVEIAAHGTTVGAVALQHVASEGVEHIAEKIAEKIDHLVNAPSTGEAVHLQGGSGGLPDEWIGTLGGQPDELWHAHQTAHVSPDPADGATAMDHHHQAADVSLDPSHQAAPFDSADGANAMDQHHVASDVTLDPSHDGANYTPTDGANAADQHHLTSDVSYGQHHDASPDPSQMHHADFDPPAH
jgi:hypothetical protein